MNYIKLILIVICFGLPKVSVSQVLNIDRENNQDSIQKKIKASIQVNFSSDKQQKNIIDFNNKSEIDYFTKKNQVVILLAQSDFAFNGANSLEKNGNIQIRFRDNDTRLIYPEIFTQFQWNGVLGLENRSVNGINIRINCLEKRSSDLYLSIGSFYEYEKWNPSISSFDFDTNISTVYRSFFRLNTVAKFAFKIANGIDFSGVSYLQFPLTSNFLKPRWYFDSNLNFEVNKYLNFLIQYEHNYDNFRALPIDNYYYSLSLGLLLKI